MKENWTECFQSKNQCAFTKVMTILVWCTINSKINGTLKGFYLLILKLHSILAVLNLLGHNNITISYYVQVNSLRLKSNHYQCWDLINWTLIFSFDTWDNKFEAALMRSLWTISHFSKNSFHWLDFSPSLHFPCFGNWWIFDSHFDHIFYTYLRMNDFVEF